MFFFFQQTDNQNQDAPKEIDFNPGLLFERIDSWLDGFIRMLPNIGVAIVVLIIFYFLARLAGRLIRKSTEKSGRENLGTVLGGFVKWTVIVLGFLLAATIVVPTLKPGDLIAGLGVSSVAIGFAFQDILQNWLAGLLILLRQPFEVGDQIVVNDYEGTVERIETRATIIKQYNNERVVIPNNDIYTNAVKVKTANEIIRSQYDVGIGYGDDIPEAIQVIKEAVKKVKGVDSGKGVEALPWDLAASWVTIRIRWWTDSERASVVKVYAQVIQEVKEALDERKIDMPYDTKVLLMHDQTEATDGDRSAQREGWPAVKEGENPKPRWKVKAEKRKERVTANGEA
ncbi:MAG: mechanosensitive ion channel family protein [Bacteroidota bacterium]